MAESKAAPDIASIAVVKLSDGSFSYNVLLKAGKTEIVLACLCRVHAERLKRELNVVAWADLA